MLLCPMLQIKNWRGAYLGAKGHSGPKADVFVTHSLPSSVHILTCDFLLHHAPSALWMGRQSLELDIQPVRALLLSRRFHRMPIDMSGGAFVVPIRVGGAIMRCTVDTGAPASLSIGYDALARIGHCRRSTPNSVLRQTGVNNEKICSELLQIDVDFCGKTFKDCVVFANSMAVEQVDGYVGMGFLRAFDMMFASEGIAFSPSGLRVKTVQDYASVTSKGKCGISIPCLHKEQANVGADSASSPSPRRSRDPLPS